MYLERRNNYQYNQVPPTTTYPLPSAYPANFPYSYPLPPNYYPAAPPSTSFGSIGLAGSAGVGALTGLTGGLGLSSLLSRKRPHNSLSGNRRYNVGPNGEKKEILQAKYVPPPPCPPGKKIGQFDTECTLPPCPSGQKTLPNGWPCQLPYCPFNQTIGLNNTPCQLPPCLPGYSVGPWGSLCALPVCPAGQTKGPFGALCTPERNATETIKSVVNITSVAKVGVEGLKLNKSVI